MDIVGPLVRSSREHQFILVVCNYATCFLEAFPMHTTAALTVLRALVKLFPRVGIPNEILTDREMNFTSSLLDCFSISNWAFQALGPFTTTHKPMVWLRGPIRHWSGCCRSLWTTKDCDYRLLFLLFADWKVPEASTGLSPFELLYGWDMKSPLDLQQE